MTKTSLSASIFGKSEKKEGSLSNLFDSSSSSLPAAPNNVNFTETAAERIKREKKEEKRRKRKANLEKTNVDTSSIPKVLEEIKEKKRKTKTANEGKSNDDKIQTDGVETTSDIAEVSSDDEARTVFVGNLPLEITRKQLETIFRECGKIKSSRLRSFGTSGVKVAPEHSGNQNLVKKVSVNTKQFMKGTPKNTAQGYVVFENMESIEKALKMNNKHIPGNKDLVLRVDSAKPTLDSTRSVFVGNLPYKSNEMTLRSHFIDGCGWKDDDDAIEGVRIVRDKETMQCRGFGYILLRDKSCVSSALGLHESTYMKKEIRVMVCGKRFKNRKGAPKEVEHASEIRGAHRRVTNKRKKQPDILKELISSTREKKEKKKRGTKKIGVKKAGVGGLSKRAASGKKVNKRVKQIQKRMEKGMGSSKK